MWWAFCSTVLQAPSRQNLETLRGYHHDRAAFNTSSLHFHILPHTLSSYKVRCCTSPPSRSYTAPVLRFILAPGGTNMEALSGVISGIAVVSLPLRLIKSIEVIKTSAHNFKDVLEDLVRLVASLERLEALLQVVRIMVEEQPSLQGQHFSAPFTIMTESLDGCEKSLQPLLYIIAKRTAP
jgi:hypothetical protein